MAGDNPTACCIMQMEAGLDTGPVLLRERIAIPAPMNYGSLHELLAGIGAQQVLTVLSQLEGGTTHPEPQAEQGVTYAAKITKTDRVIDWNQPAERVLDHIRGLSPSPAAITVLGDEVVKIFAAKVESGSAEHAPGTVLDDALLINAACGTALRLTEIQRPNRARQSGNEAQRNFGIAVGSHAKNPIPT
jgi:methionyl-tRNA formyltransferase